MSVCRTAFLKNRVAFACFATDYADEIDFEWQTICIASSAGREIVVAPSP